MVKLVAVDMDGTFLNDDKKISPEFDKILKELRKKDIHFCVASGRQLESLKRDFKNYEDEIIFLADNGTMLQIYGDLKNVDSFDIDTKNKIMECIDKTSNKRVVYSTKICSYIDMDDKLSIENAEQYMPNYKVVNNFDEVEELPMKISLFSENGYDSDFKMLSEELKDYANVCTSGYEWLDIIPKSINKGNGIIKIQETLNINSDETMVFGDEMNDYEMIKNAGYSYAMENAVEKIKAAAKYMAPTNNEFGVVKVIKKHFNIV